MFRIVKSHKTYVKYLRRNYSNVPFFAADGLTILSERVKSSVSFEGKEADNRIAGNVLRIAQAG